MRTAHLAMTALVTAALALVPCTARAAGAFDGTWKTNVAHSKPSTKPVVWLLANGMYTCTSCTPPAYSVKADGTDQKVAGHAFDTVAVTVDGNTVQTVFKLHGKVINSAKMVVTGDSLSRAYTDVTGAQPFVEKMTLSRVSAGPPGSHPFSGSWRVTKIDSESDAGSTTTYGITDDGFTMSSNGQSYDAKFDGKKYAVVGDPTNLSVTVKKLSPTEVEERDYRDGKLLDIVHLSVSADGKTIHGVDTAVQVGRTGRYTLDRVSGPAPVAGH
jgi:hypothetical protein